MAAGSRRPNSEAIPRQDAAHLHGARAALFERRIVEIGVGIGVENFVRKDRRHGVSTARQRIAALRYVAEDVLQALEVQGLGEHVFHRLAHQRMIGNCDVADDIFLAGERLRKNRGQQIVGAHALNLRRNFFAALEAQQAPARARRPSASARVKQRRGEHGLLQHFLHGVGVQEMKHVGERKAVLLAQGDIQAVVGGRGLQLKIERAAEALAQRQPPGLVDARAERRVDDQLHAAAFVEEALGDDQVLRGHRAQHGAARQRVIDGLLGAGFVEAALALEPGDRRAAACGDSRRCRQIELADLLAQLGQLLRKARRCAPGASPRQKGTLGGAPCASSTSTRPRSTRRMRQEVFPSSMMSPARLSTAKSSSTVPTTASSGVATTV